jgi:hypothetical protein
MAKTVEKRIRVSFQYVTKAMIKAEIKVEKPARVRPTFSEIPSWITFVSAVMRVVTVPAPRLSKKPMFWRMQLSR